MLTPEKIRFIRFCVVGGTGVGVNLGIFTLFNSLILTGSITDDTRFIVSNALGIIVSIFTNFLLNDFWTWGDREKRGRAHLVSRLLKFYLVSSIAASVQIGVAWTVREQLGSIDQVAVLTGIAVATGINYAANHLWTFKPSK